MLAVAHSPDFAKRVGIPQKVGKDFTAADKATGKFQPKHTEANMAKAKKDKKKK